MQTPFPHSLHPKTVGCWKVGLYVSLEDLISKLESQNVVEIHIAIAKLSLFYNFVLSIYFYILLS